MGKQERGDPGEKGGGGGKNLPASNSSTFCIMLCWNVYQSCLATINSSLVACQVKERRCPEGEVTADYVLGDYSNLSKI